MDKIFKAYDIRGIFPEDISREVAFKIGRAFAEYLKVDTICIGRDMRLSSPEIFRGLMEGIRKQGVNVIDLGLVSTDMVYFATGKFGYGGGVMITASHNPGQWNGMKMCAENAFPISSDNGLPEIKELAELNNFKEDKEEGSLEEKNIYDDWINFALSFVDPEKINSFKIAVDAGNGMAGSVIPHLQKKLSKLEILPMFFELDGSFPNHLASPIEPENTEELRIKVKKEGLDLGLAFDGDADRVFFVDDEGVLIPGTIITAMIAELILKRNEGATILYNVICGKVVQETIESLGGFSKKTKVGHSLIKAEMKKTGALFAGEHSGHYYFKENFNADSALIATLIVLQLISEYGIKLSELHKRYKKYFDSGEINSKVDDINKKIESLKTIYSDANRFESLDGISFYYDKYWFNIRPSNTEPLLRLNLEADNLELMEKKTKEVLHEIRK